MHRHAPSTLTVASLLLPLTLSGCLERQETITVRPDGSLEVVHVIRGDAADLDGGAARYPSGPPFEVERSTRVKEDGKEEHVLSARAVFPHAAAVPDRFGDGDATALHLDTRLERTAEAGGTRYTFARTYAPREWADYRFFHARAFPDEVKALLQRPGGLDALAPEERRRVLGAVVAYERLKAQRWSDAALREAAPGGPSPAHRLAVREAVAAFFARELPIEAVESLLDLARRAPGELATRSRELQARHDQEVTAVAATVAGLTPEQQAAFAQAVGRERRAFEVSEDLGDERFVVRLRLPGRVLAHNADAVEDGALVWRFSGEDLRERRHDLLATSLLETN